MLHAALLAAATVAAPVTLPPRPPDATYSYAIQSGGVALGSSIVTVDGSTPGTVVVKENVSMSVPRSTATATTRYDAATLHETGYTGDFNLPSGVQHTDVTVKPGAMTLTVPGGGTLDIPADPSAPLELVGDNLVGGSIMIPAVLHATGAKSFTLAVLGGARPLVCKVVSDPLPSRPAGVPASDVELALELAGIRVISWYDPATYVVHDVAIPSQQAEFRLTATAAPGTTAPPSPAPSLRPLPTPTPHFTSRDVGRAQPHRRPAPRAVRHDGRSIQRNPPLTVRRRPAVAPGGLQMYAKMTYNRWV